MLQRRVDSYIIGTDSLLHSYIEEQGGEEKREEERRGEERRRDETRHC